VKNRKAASHHDVLLTVLAVQHPELDDCGKLLLTALATRTQGDTGEHAYPGREALGESISRSVDTVRKRLKKLCDLGLIIQTHESTGRGNANEYKLNLEHPAYPDGYIGISKKAKLGKVLVQDKRIQMKGAYSDAERCLSEHGKVLIEAAKGAYLGTPPVVTSPKKSTVTPSPTRKESSAVNRLIILFVAEEGKQPTLTKLHRADLVANIRAYGANVVAAVFEYYLKTESFATGTNEKWPFFNFNAGFAGYLQKAEWKNQELGQAMWAKRCDLTLFALDQFEPEFLQTLDDEQRDCIDAVQSYRRFEVKPVMSNKEQDQIASSIDVSNHIPFVAIRKLHRVWYEEQHPEPEEVTPDGQGEEPR
jgi:hypothetical protein